MYPRNLKRKCRSKCGKKFSNCFSKFVNCFKKRYIENSTTGSSFLREPPVRFGHFKIYVIVVQVRVCARFFQNLNPSEFLSLVSPSPLLLAQRSTVLGLQRFRIRV
jgi:hypothetical protein